MFRKVWNYITTAFRWVRKHKYLVVTLIFLLFVFVIDDNSMIKHIGNQQKISELKAEIAQLRRDSAKVMMQQMQFDKPGEISEIEKIAREKYDMQNENEDVFIIE